MKKKIFILIGILAVIVPALYVFIKISKKGAIVTFETVEVLRGNINSTVTATGTIEAITTVKVGTQVSGILKGVYVDFNDAVKKGEVLARFDETSLRAQVEQSQAQVDQARAQLNYNESTFNRVKVLYEKNLISRADYDQAVFNYENSKGALVNSESNLERSKVNLDYATITSPIDGLVLNRAVEEGQTVAASFNTPELFTIVNDLTQMEVRTSVDEADIGKVIQGQRVEFTVDAWNDLRFTAEVSEVRLQPITTNNVVTYSVILSAPNPGKKLMPGMTASATIYVEEKENALVIPARALRFRPDPEYLKRIMAERAGKRSGDVVNTPQSEVSSSQASSGDSSGVFANAMISAQRPAEMKIAWIRDEQGGIQMRAVTIGIDNGINVEILTGMSEGDKVVVSMTWGDENTSSSDSGIIIEAPQIPNGMPGHGG